MDLPSSQSPGDEFIGSVLADKYQIIELIGEGGMGAVYKGRHILMDRIVAVKLVHSRHAGDRSSLDRFQREAQASSCLSHPNVMAVFDFGISPAGTAYLIMDYLQGESLSDLLERERYLPWQRAVNIFLQACDALAHAHKNGVIHRDLKPSNIMLVALDGRQDIVKIVDFGIAKLLPGTGRSAQQLTQTGEVFGSPLYMSPEQCMGQAQDGRSDIYALGCLMYETLCGQPPVLGENVLSIIYKHINELPPPFAVAAPDIYIPDALEGIIFKALDKVPEMRYQSMQDLRSDLEKLVKEGSSGSPALRSGPDSANPAPGIAPQAISSSSWLEESTAPMARAPGGSPQPDALEREYLASLKRCEDLNGPASQKIIPYLQRLAELYRHQGRFPDAESRYIQIVKTLVKARGHFDLTVAEAVYKLADFYHEHRRYEEAEPLYQDALEIKRRALGDDHPDLSFLLNCLGDLYGSLSRFEEAEQAYKQALFSAEKAFGAGDSCLIPILVALANTMQTLGRYEESERLFKRALYIKEATLGANHTDHASTLVSLGILSRYTGKYLEGERYFGRALNIYEHAWGSDHPDVASTLTFLADLYADEGLSEDAESLYKRAIAIKERLLGPANIELAPSYETLAVHYLVQNNYTDAEDWYRRGLEIRENAVGPDHPDNALALSGLAVVYHGAGRADLAEKYYKLSIAAAQRDPYPDESSIAITMHNLGDLYREQNRLQEAEDLLRRAIALQEHALGPRHQKLVPGLESLSALLRQLGRDAEADSLALRAQAIADRGSP